MKIIVAVIAALLAVAVSLSGCLQSNGPQHILVGNDSDIHGCKGSAGYSWCDATQKCIRAWEENCTAPNEGINQSGGPLVGNDSDIHGCKGSAGYSWCDATQKCIRAWEENCTAANGGSGIANPASVNCVDNGYSLTIRTDSEGGQYGVCSKPGYTECEEWALYRGNCTIVPLGKNGSAMNATGRDARTEGQFCGGIAAIPCQEGLHCRLNGSYPDAGGACIRDCNCTLMTNGTAMGCFGCAYAKVTGAFNCTSAPEGWQPYEREPGAIGIPYACYCTDVNTADAKYGGCELAQ